MSKIHVLYKNFPNSSKKSLSRNLTRSRSGYVISSSDSVKRKLREDISKDILSYASKIEW